MNSLCTYRFTILVSAISLVAWAVPSLAEWLVLDFRLVGEGQWWRIWTGHVTHYDGNHLFYDLLMFAVLGAACERAHRKRFGFALVAMMMGVSIAIFWWCEGIAVYRGLSGIDTGFFVWLVADQSRQCWSERRRVFSIAWAGAVVALLGKLAFEAATGETLFVDSTGFTPLVESHLAGAGLGLIAHAWLRFDSGAGSETATPTPTSVASAT